MQEADGLPSFVSDVMIHTYIDSKLSVELVHHTTCNIPWISQHKREIIFNYFEAIHQVVQLELRLRMCLQYWVRLVFFTRRYPVRSGFITCGIKAAAADIVAQMSEVKKHEEELESRARSPRFRGRLHLGKGGVITLRSQKAAARFDMLHSLSFLLYGGFYQGMAQ